MKIGTISECVLKQFRYFMLLLASRRHQSNPEHYSKRTFFVNFYFVCKVFFHKFSEISVKDFTTIGSMRINKNRMVNMSFIRPELQTQGQRRILLLFGLPV